MENNSYKKINSTLLNSSKKIILNDTFEKYLDDISDSGDEEDGSTFRRNKHNDILNTLSNKDIEKKNTKDTKGTKSTKPTDTNSSENSMEYEFVEELKNNVISFVRTDDKIRELQKQIKELKISKKQSEENVLKHLEKMGENNIIITDGKLLINQYSSKGSFNIAKVKEALSLSINDKNTIDKIFQYINKQQLEEKKIRFGLKRTHKK